MSFEQPSIDKKSKREMTEDEREFAKGELERTEEILVALEAGDENYAYADTSECMDFLDSVLGENVTYKNTLQMRKEASGKIIQGSAEEKRQGIDDVKGWIQQTRKLL